MLSCNHVIVNAFFVFFGGGFFIFFGADGGNVGPGGRLWITPRVIHSDPFRLWIVIHRLKVSLAISMLPCYNVSVEREIRAGNRVDQAWDESAIGNGNIFPVNLVSMNTEKLVWRKASV